MVSSKTIIKKKKKKRKEKKKLITLDLSIGSEGKALLDALLGAELGLDRMIEANSGHTNTRTLLEPSTTKHCPRRLRRNETNVRTKEKTKRKRQTTPQ